MHEETRERIYRAENLKVRNYVSALLLSHVYVVLVQSKVVYRMGARNVLFLINLLLIIFPRILWKLHRDAQPNPHCGEHYDIGKVSTQDVTVQGECKQRRGSSWSDHALNRDHRLCDSIRSAE